ncbi:hypothetical protein RB195_018359 [Necator americanus]|uniref:IFT140 first beta-propeller domain-containing protein n=1 Tax=Necator americanus TaxID=51031 RepID=A0ABR1CB17_NECAM
MEKIFSWSSCSGWLCLACPVQDAVQINFFTHKGSRSENVVVQRKSDVSTIAWHPTEVIVCVAWSDGLLNILSPESSEYAATENVGSKVLFLSWSADGKSLCAAKEDGKCYLYASNGKNSLIKSAECQINDRPTAMCDRVSVLLNRGNPRGPLRVRQSRNKYRQDS